MLAVRRSTTENYSFLYTILILSVNVFLLQALILLIAIALIELFLLLTELSNECKPRSLPGLLVLCILLPLHLVLMVLSIVAGPAALIVVFLAPENIRKFNSTIYKYFWRDGWNYRKHFVDRMDSLPLDD